MDIQRYILIEKGEPYHKGERIRLTSKDIVIGRAAKDYIPDICFNSLYISRRHALIFQLNNTVFIKDLASTHGTIVNEKLLKPEKPYELMSGDSITFVNGLVVLTYQEETDLEKTITLPRDFSLEKEGLFIDINKKRVWYKGKIINITGKARDLLFLLEENKNTTISYEEIKKILWKERELGQDGLPDVGNEEIYALVYRLRKQLGEELEKSIVTVSGYGLVLEE